MEGLAVGLRDLPVAHGAFLEVVRRLPDQALVGLFLGDDTVITLVAELARKLQVDVLPDQVFVHHVSFIVIFRLDRRRHPRSPLPFAPHCRGFHHGLHDCRIGVAGDTGARLSGVGGHDRKKKQGEGNQKGSEKPSHGRALTVVGKHVAAFL